MLERRAALPANMSETVTPGKSSVEGESGSEADKHGGAARADICCSERTMYRVLAAHQEVRERRNQLRHPHHAAPELLARRPNELWSWDITKLLGPAK